MNNADTTRPAEMNELLMLEELSSGEPISQREIASRLGIALGLANSYLKTLVHKGYVQIKTCPRNRYAYLITPTGMTEKSRYIYQQVTRYHQIFHHTRQDCSQFFRQLHAKGVREVSFCGIDEFTEIAYLSLREAQLHLGKVFDDRMNGERFIDHDVLPLVDAAQCQQAAFIITALRDPERYRSELLNLGINADSIYLPISERI